jgi:response regulator RpfG family c-di-GMP phosphodiesterase
VNNFRVLLVDDEEPIREIMSFGIGLKHACEVVEAEDGMHAIEILGKDDKFDLVFCDYNMPNANGGEVYQFLLDKGLNIPYVMCSSDLPTDYEIFQQGELFGNIQKPSIMEGLDEIFEKLSSSMDNFIELKQKFVPISLNILTKLSFTPVDLYLKVSDEKVLKVLRTNEQFTEEDYKKYKDKGLASLLIEQCDGEVFLKVLEENILSLLEGKEELTDVEIRNIHSIISNVASSFGFSSAIVELTNKSIDHSMKVINSDKQLKKLFDNLIDSGDYLSNHAVVCAHLATAIASNLDVLADKKDEAIKKLNLACFLQDLKITHLGIKQYEDIAYYYDEEATINREKKKDFSQHPYRAAEEIQKTKGFPPDVDKIINEHEERPDGSGFPKGLVAKQLTHLSSAFILTNMIAHLIFRNYEMRDQMSIDLVVQSLDLDQYEGNNFADVIEAFKKSEIF